MQSRLRESHILSFNDFHRRLKSFPDGTAGAAKLTTALRQKKAEYSDCITVNLGDVAGDNAKPGPRAFNPIAPLFNRMQVDILALGNHEFEDPTEGYRSLREGLIQPLQGKVLCANIVEKGTGKPLPGTQPFTIEKLGGINIAFIGVCTRELATAFFPTAGAGLSTLPIEATLKEMIPRTREAGADAVVVLAHENYNTMKEMAPRLEADIILPAHDHRLTEGMETLQRNDGGTVSMGEAGAYGRNFLDIKLITDPEAKKLVSVEGTMNVVSADITPDDGAVAIVEEHTPVEKRREIPQVRSGPTFNSFKDLAQWWDSAKGEPNKSKEAV